MRRRARSRTTRSSPPPRSADIPLHALRGRDRPASEDQAAPENREIPSAAGRRLRFAQASPPRPEKGHKPRGRIESARRIVFARLGEKRKRDRRAPLGRGSAPASQLKKHRSPPPGKRNSRDRPENSRPPIFSPTGIGRRRSPLAATDRAPGPLRPTRGSG